MQWNPDTRTFINRTAQWRDLNTDKRKFAEILLRVSWAV